MRAVIARWRISEPAVNPALVAHVADTVDFLTDLSPDDAADRAAQLVAAHPSLVTAAGAYDIGAASATDFDAAVKAALEGTAAYRWYSFTAGAVIAQDAETAMDFATEHRLFGAAAVRADEELTRDYLRARQARS